MVQVGAVDADEHVVRVQDLDLLRLRDPADVLGRLVRATLELEHALVVEHLRDEQRAVLEYDKTSTTRATQIVFVAEKKDYEDSNNKKRRQSYFGVHSDVAAVEADHDASPVQKALARS